MNLGSMDKMIITSSESKDILGRSVNRLITSLSLKDKTRPKKYKKARYSIRNFSMKDLSKIIREFDKLTYKSYDRRRPKHEPTDSCFYLVMNIPKCMVRDDALNSHVYSKRRLPMLSHTFLVQQTTPTPEPHRGLNK